MVSELSMEITRFERCDFTGKQMEMIISSNFSATTNKCRFNFKPPTYSNVTIFKYLYIHQNMSLFLVLVTKIKENNNEE